MKKVLILLIGLFLLNMVLALNMTSSIDTDILVKGVENSIMLTLNVTDAEPGLYNVFTLSDVIISPMEPFNVETNNFEKKFEIRASENLDIDGLYTFTFTLNQRGVEKFDEKLTINLLDLEDVIKISSDNINTSSPEMEFYVQNLKDVHLRNLDAEFSSLVFKTKGIFNLEPFEKKYIKVIADEYKLKRTQAGVYVIDAVFKTSKGKREISGTLFLGENKGISTITQESGIFIRTNKISKINAGNVIESTRIQITKNIISRFFTIFNMEPNVIERRGFYVDYVWVRERLGPAEVITIESTTNYVFPFLILIVAILAIMGIKRYSQAKIIVKKSVKPVRTKGGEFALKVILDIKAVNEVSNLSLTDAVPRMVKLYKKFTGTHPDKIDPHARKIHWHIGDLHRGEERIISYIVYSKVGVIGKFSLPKAKALFEKDSQVHEVDSNTVFFMNEQINKE